MRKANIIVFEDQPQYIDGIIRNFDPGNNGTEYSFSIIAMADNMTDARELIDKLEEHEADVAVVDGNLSPGEVKCREGKEIVFLLKDKFADIVTIGYSNSPRDFGADVNVSKQDGYKPLVDCIKDL